MPSLPQLPQQHADSTIDGVLERPPTPVPQRVAMWQLEGSLQCSVIGTCLSEQDLLTAIRKHRLQLERDACSYDIHSYCVRAAHRDCPLARSLNKLLERKYAGAIRLMGRATTAVEMQSLWERLRDGGQLAAGYWAVMSHSHVPSALRTRAFGEVHMLSHLHGHGATQLACRLTESQQRCADLEARLRRSEAAKNEALADLEARLRRSEAAKNEALADRDAARAAPVPHAAAHAQPPDALRAVEATHDRSLRRLQARLAKCERALIVARSRARGAEAEARRLDAAARSSRRSLPEGSRGPQPLAAAADTAVGLVRHRVLYLGGRAAIVPHLRSAAEARLAAFSHHDGGIEDSLHRIEEMIAGCDAVVCPVDCVSHGACRMAKAICQRLKRRFMPIPTASRSGFERALDRLATEPGSPHGEAALQ